MHKYLCKTLALLLVLAAFVGLIVPVSASSAISFAELLPVLTAGEHSVDPNKPILRRTVAVHYGPSAGSMVIGQLEDSTPVTVLGVSGDYYRIDCYDMDGYIHRSLVERKEVGYAVKHSFSSPDSLYLTDRSVGASIFLKNDLYATAVAQQGVPYVLGGTSPRGFDCSGFTQYVYRQNGITIPRTCEGQIGAGLIVAREDLQCGDLILFTRTNHPTALVTHVGMYLGDGKLIHAGSGGITVVELGSRYFTEHYLCARRVVPTRQQAVPRLLPVCAEAEGAVITPRTRSIP